MSLLLPRDNQAHPFLLLVQPHPKAQLLQRPLTAQLLPHRITLQDLPFLPSLLQYHRTTTPLLSPQLLQPRLTAQLFPHRITLQDPLLLLSLLKFNRTTTPLPSPQRDPLSKGQVFHRRRCERFNAFNIFLEFGPYDFFSSALLRFLPRVLLRLLRRQFSIPYHLSDF